VGKVLDLSELRLKSAKAPHPSAVMGAYNEPLERKGGFH
jgi:hypothetical protein